MPTVQFARVLAGARSFKGWPNPLNRTCEAIWAVNSRTIAFTTEGEKERPVAPKWPCFDNSSAMRRKVCLLPVLAGFPAKPFGYGYNFRPFFTVRLAAFNLFPHLGSQPVTCAANLATVMAFIELEDRAENLSYKAWPVGVSS